MSTQDVASPVL